jgi:hypothetical protein
MSAILPHREITPQRPDSLADETVVREPVSGRNSLLTGPRRRACHRRSTIRAPRLSSSLCEPHAACSALPGELCAASDAAPSQPSGPQHLTRSGPRVGLRGSMPPAIRERKASFEARFAARSCPIRLFHSCSASLIWRSNSNAERAQIVPIFGRIGGAAPTFRHGTWLVSPFSEAAMTLDYIVREPPARASSRGCLVRLPDRRP